MTPIKLKLHNFRTLADTELDLSAISLASVVAKNGSGKSSLLTLAPLFALFGKYPGGSIDDLVRTGTQDMAVTFDFEHNGKIYQIIRTRKLGKKSTCEFQGKTATGWESLTGTTIKETDAKIQQLLNIDADTFLASSLILQGDVSNFSRKLPSERKAVLTSILGLDIYSTLQEQAKAKAKALELKLEGNKQELERLSNSLEKLPDIDTDLALINQQITLKAVDIKAKETELADIQTEIKALEAKEQEAKQIQSQIKGLENEINVKKAEIISLENRIAEAEAILQSEPEIMQKVQELNELRQQIPALEAKATRLTELQTELDGLEDEETRLIDEEHALATKIFNLLAKLSIKSELQQVVKQHDQLSAELKDYDLKQEQDDVIAEKISEMELKERNSGFYLKELQSELDAHQKKTDILLNSGCIDSEKANCKFLQDAQEARKRIPLFNNEIEATIRDREPLIQEIAALTREREQIAYDKAHHADLKKRLELLQKKVDQYNSLEGKEELLQNLNEQREGLSQRIETLDEQRVSLNAEIRTLEAETKSLPILKAKIPGLEVYVKQKDRLPEAKAIIRASREQIHKLDIEAMTKEDQILALKGDIGDLFINSIASPKEGFAPAIQFIKISEQLRQAELKELQSDQNRLFDSRGALTNQLNTLTLDKEKHDSLSAELAPQAKELVKWQTLVKAFGKNGIPALIIENAIPELERISNDILSQMSGGANSLQFITQRDAKSKDSMIETLDILVRDWAGTRPFESFSGGEQTRISLAIRFALSELLANRAGSKVEFIVGDEILSDQSPEFREMTIEAIKNMAGRFKKILVISHIPEIQGAFDQQITISDGKVDVKFS